MYNLLAIGTWLIVAVLVYCGGVISKALAEKYAWRAPIDADPKDRTLYDVTLFVHPPIAAALLGLIPWPTFHAIEDLGGWIEILVRVSWFTMAGVFCGRVYAGVDNVVENLDDKVLDFISASLRLSPAALPKRSARVATPDPASEEEA